MSKITVATPSLEYQTWADLWALPLALLGGSVSMREAGRTYLPQERGEDLADYQSRLLRNILFNGYGKTVRTLSSRPFCKPVTVELSDPQLEYLADSPSGESESQDLTSFTRRLLADMLIFNTCHFLVDFPTNPFGRELTLAEQNDLNVKPYFSRISPSALIERKTQMVGGTEVVTRIRFTRTTTEVVDTWGEEAIKEVVVVTPESFDVYRLNDKSEWFIYESRVNTLGKVALVTVEAADQTATPLESLAEQNLLHWQSSADHRHILHVARVPILFGKGIPADQLAEIKVSPNSFVKVSPENADLKYVEHSGQAIGAGVEDLNMIKEQMAIMGADLLVEKSGNATATGRVIDEAESVSDLQSMTRSLESGLEQGYMYAAEWLEIPKLTIDVSIFQDFSISLRSASELEFLLKMRVEKEISRLTFFSELKRRGVFTEGFDAETEISLVDKNNSTQNDGN